MISLENNVVLQALLTAVVPSVLSYIVGSKSSSIQKQDNATSHWKSLYETMKIERDEYSQETKELDNKLEKLSQEFNEFKTEFNKMKQSYIDQLAKVEEENKELKEDNQRLVEENKELKQVVLNLGGSF